MPPTTTAYGLTQIRRRRHEWPGHNASLPPSQTVSAQHSPRLLSLSLSRRYFTGVDGKLKKKNKQNLGGCPPRPPTAPHRHTVSGMSIVTQPPPHRQPQPTFVCNQVNVRIEEAFTRHVIGSDIVAYYISTETDDTDVVRNTSIEYFDRKVRSAGLCLMSKSKRAA